MKVSNKSIAINSLFLTQQMLLIYREFNKKHLKFIPIKGSIWALEIYKNYSERYFSDIDFLFNINDFVLVDQILVGLGFERKKPLNENLEEFIFHNHEFQYVKYIDGKRVLVEPHYKLYNHCTQVSVTMNDLFFLTKKETMQNEKLNVLNSNGILLVSILNHLVSDNFQQQKHSNEIEKIIKLKSDELDWDELQRIANSCGFINHFCFSLKIVELRSTLRFNYNLHKSCTNSFIFKILLKYSLLKFGKSPNKRIIIRRIETIFYNFLLASNWKKSIAVLYYHMIYGIYRFKYNTLKT